MAPVPLAFALSAALLPSPAPDLVPDAIEAVLAQPDEHFFFGISPMLDADPLAAVHDVGFVRCLADVGDVTGDGAPDLAVGSQPRSAAATLSVRDGRTGELVWSARPGGDPHAGFRSLRGLSARDGRLAAAGSTRDGSVCVLDAASGTPLWRRALAAPDASDPAQLYAVSWIDDVDGDAQADVVVAGGHRVDAVALLSGADGTLIALHAVGDVVYDVRPVPDLDGDGRPEIVAVGGDAQPFARLLSGADLAPLWDVPLDGPGSAVLLLDDVNGDGVRDLAAGEFGAPGASLVALDGSDGTRLWTCHDIVHDVTSLALIDDMLGTGLRDIAVGSFDNAISAVLSFYGLVNWRREVTTNNGGEMFSVAATTDLDGNGFRDVYACSLDRRPYVMGGETGQFMAGYEARAKLCAVLALGDGNGDGRPELVVGGRDALWIFDGNAGTADGPFVVVKLPSEPGGETAITVWAYPTSYFYLYVSPMSADPLTIPGVGGMLQLDLATIALLAESPAPGAGLSTYNLPPFPPEAAGLRVFVQALAKYQNGARWISNLALFTVPG